MKKNFLISILLLFIVFFAGCQNTAKTKQTTDSQSATQQTITITDTDGKQKIPFNPKKVIVFDANTLDTMNQLGVGNKVVGTATQNLPDYLKKFRSVESAGGIKEPDLEKINALKPDLIIISGRQADFKEQLSKIAPTIYLSVDNTKTYESIKQNVQTIGKIFNKEKLANQKLTALDKKIKQLQNKTKNLDKKALFVLYNEGSLAAFGNGSRFGVVFDTFGFTSADDHIQASIHGQNVSYEYVLQKNPDILFVMDRTKAIGGDTTSQAVNDNDLVKQTKAGQTNKIINLNPQVWYLAGSGLQAMDIMIKDVSKAL